MIQIDMTGHVAVVTGGTKGVGRGIAQRFADAGATVVVGARNAVDDLPSDWTFLPADLRDAEAAAAFIDAVVEAHGRIDVLVNNAGGSPPADTATAPARFTQRIVDLNMLSSIYTSQRANHHMQAGDGGSIININSVVSIRPAPTTAAYGAAKAGLASFTLTAGQEWAPKVRVNGVISGMVRTEQAELFYGDAEGIARVEATIPIGRLALPADIGNACVFLSSPMASYITGTNLLVHGGGDRPPFLDA
jgi:NAD(P)-dependent dehydrogenase (short-subunit alcohol dehydrogenase family)